jgi:diaminohydroxyphosphoribosylaminopyrimidine deaminase/5-amino-6-(5-phosphoribosylamino)uracil reductase
MRRALILARRGIGTTHPNPRVGALVRRDGSIVGEGFHVRPGDAHAEISALLRAGALARGATLIVTLEPCAHQGRTPPCVDAILAAGIERVVIGMKDPNPLVDGRGIERLRAAGLEVVVGALERECRALNPPYLKQLETGLPWVTLKAMLTLDGRMASDSGESRGLGGEAEQRLCHRLRAESDAILVGIGTVLADNPLLTVRLARGRTPLRVVVDTRLRTPLDSRLLTSVTEGPVVVATTSADDRARIAALEARGVEVWSFAPDAEGHVPLRALLERLALAGRFAVLAEGGSALHTSLLRENLADRVAVGLAPTLIGGRRAPTMTGDLGRASLAEAIPLRDLRARKIGRDVWLEGEIARDEGESNV